MKMNEMCENHRIFKKFQIKYLKIYETNTYFGFFSEFYFLNLKNELVTAVYIQDKLETFGIIKKGWM
jgi:hypothetical protein